ncbi:hypothetical protein F441_04479 [Phytophthora nicotianae CJ01A1]|uniref:Uncharacterized protein n=2 Tax=Phytophthora nicotianae TaxID=4792 RepID=W2ZSN9_PHYNI|nr:hypothetical protein F441_04479 [Phytophthora nicotianae CJ01A1]ETP50041.1 hypothetical protein F442_04540 [Phytophthora nicotianae P10297]
METTLHMSSEDSAKYPSPVKEAQEKPWRMDKGDANF